MAEKRHRPDGQLRGVCRPTSAVPRLTLDRPIIMAQDLCLDRRRGPSDSIVRRSEPDLAPGGARRCQPRTALALSVSWRPTRRRRDAIIGGADIFRAALPQADRILLLVRARRRATCGCRRRTADGRDATGADSNDPMMNSQPISSSWTGKLAAPARATAGRCASSPPHSIRASPFARTGCVPYSAGNTLISCTRMLSALPAFGRAQRARAPRPSRSGAIGWKGQ